MNSSQLRKYTFSSPSKVSTGLYNSMQLYNPVCLHPMIIFLSVNMGLHFLVFYISTIIQYCSFCLVSFIHHNYFEFLPYSCMYQYFLILLQCSIPLHIYITTHLTIHPLMDIWIFFYHFWYYKWSCLYIFVQIFLWTFFIFLWYILRSRMSVLYGRCMFNFLETAKLFSTVKNMVNYCIILHSY